MDFTDKYYYIEQIEVASFKYGFLFYKGDKY